MSVHVGVVAPVRPASPLPPNVPTGPRNQNKYRDRDGNAPAVDGLDYGGGGGGGGSGVVSSANERERDIRDRDRERSERDSHRDRDRGERDRDSHRDRDRDRSERDRERSDRPERDRERERDRSVKEDGRGRRTPSAELEDWSSNRYVFLVTAWCTGHVHCVLLGSGGAHRDWKIRVHQNGASVLTTTKLIHRNFTY